MENIFFSYTSTCVAVNPQGITGTRVMTAIYLRGAEYKDFKRLPHSGLRQ